MTLFADMLLALMERNSLNQTSLATKLGIKPQSVNQWLGGTSKPGRKTLPLLAEALGVTVDDLLNNRVPAEVKDIKEGLTTRGNVGVVYEQSNHLYNHIPFLSAKAQRVTSHIMFDHSQLTQIEELYPVTLPAGVSTINKLAIEIVGDSMEPELRHGDIVVANLIDSDLIKYKSGGIVAVQYSGGFVIKRVKTNDIIKENTLTLWSDNEKYGQITVLADDIKCMFEVTQFAHRVVR